jgi:hypothetical protein
VTVSSPEVEVTEEQRITFARIFDEERKMWLLPLMVTSEPAFHDFVYNCMALAAAQARASALKEAVEVIEPFARGAARIDSSPKTYGYPSDESGLGMGSLTLGDLRRARAFVEKVNLATGTPPQFSD